MIICGLGILVGLSGRFEVTRPFLPQETLGDRNELRYEGLIHMLVVLFGRGPEKCFGKRLLRVGDRLEVDFARLEERVAIDEGHPSGQLLRKIELRVVNGALDSAGVVFIRVVLLGKQKRGFEDVGDDRAVHFRLMVFGVVCGGSMQMIRVVHANNLIEGRLIRGGVVIIV
jgi:hypothetical protein